MPPDLKIINMLNLGSGPARQILVRAKIIDIDRSATKSLGIDWGTGSAGAARGGNTYTFNPQPILFGQTSQAESFSGLFGGGRLDRISPIAAQLSALITEDKARVLSEPSLMVLDGSEGSILVGGELPIPVAQASNGTSGTSASVSIEYKPYGVRLSVGAALVGDKRVQLTVTPEVSELDYGAAIQISGFSVPALTVRRATSVPYVHHPTQATRRRPAAWKTCRSPGQMSASPTLTKISRPCKAAAAAKKNRLPLSCSPRSLPRKSHNPSMT